MVSGMIYPTMCSDRLLVFAEEACSEGWQEEEAGPEVHAGLHSPCGGWHHGRCQLCTCTGRCRAA